MSVEGFRFSPPAVVLPPALRWVLARAYAAGDTTLAETEGGAAVDLAQGLALAARIAAVQPQARLTGELGPQSAAELKRQRALAVAQEMRLGTALRAVDATAADLRIPYVPLKGQALVLGGYAPDGGRPSSDLDLLVPESRLDALQKELQRQGFSVAGESYEHQAPALRHFDGGMVELHRVLPGVCIEAKRSATYGALLAAGLFSPPPSAMAFRPRGDLRLPRRELLTAHALVHAIAQHGLAPAVFPGFLFLGDLVDLAFRGSGGRATLAAITPWIEREVSYEEAEAALDLATALAAGDATLFDPPGLQKSGPGNGPRNGSAHGARSPARRLLDHYYAGVADPGYALALKNRLLERPLSDKPQAVAKAQLLAKTLAPRPGESFVARLRFLWRRLISVRAAGKRK